MKNTLFALILLSSSLFGNEVEKFFKASETNSLICRIGYEAYIKISQKNSNIEKINGTGYFHFKNRDLYLPVSSCHPIKKEGKGLIF